MKRGKMLKSFTITLLAVGLLAGCSKRTEQPKDVKLKNADKVEAKKIKIDPADIIVGEKYDASNPKGGETENVVTVLTAEDQEARVKANAQAPIILGRGAANVSFESSILNGVETLSKPYYSGSEENPYAWGYDEGVFIRWGKDPAQGRLIQSISINEDYKGGFDVTFAPVQEGGEPQVVTIKIGDSLKHITSMEAVQAQFINTIYQNYVDAAEPNCMASQKCFPYEQDDLRLWVIAQEIYGKNGHIYIYFDENFDKITDIYMTTPNPEWDRVALANSKKPILLVEGAAGINFNMTREEVEEILSVPEQKNEENATYTYGEKIMVTWGVNADEGMKPQMIRAFNGYQGVLEVPGLGQIRLGQDLSEIVPDMNAFYQVMISLYNQTYNKDASYNCGQTQECGWYPESDTIFVFVANNAYSAAFFLSEDKKSIVELLMFTPSPETEVVVEEPTATPTQGGDPATEVPQYAAAPVELGASAAGVTWNTTKEQAAQFLVELPSQYAYSVYEGGVIIQWTGAEGTSTPAVIYLQGDYQGKFNVPGYEPIGIGTPTSAFIDLSSEDAFNTSFAAFANAAYRVVFPDTAAGFDCVATEQCVFTQASNGYYELYFGQRVRIDFTPDFSVVAGILMMAPTATTGEQAEQQEETVTQEPVTEQPAEPTQVPDYAKAPIVIGSSIAGLTFDTLESEATMLEQLPMDFGDPSVKLYKGGVIVQWGADSKPMVMVAFAANDGYQGKVTFPDNGQIGLGESISAKLGAPMTPELFQAVANLIYDTVYGPMPAGYNCAAEQTCGLGSDSTGAPVLIIGAEGKIQLYFTPDMDRVVQIVMISPNASMAATK